MTMVFVDLMPPPSARNSTVTNSKPLVPTRMKILSALPSSDSREESTTTEAVLQHRRDDGDIEDDFVLVSTSINGSQERRRHRLDRFGFIANMDRHGNLIDEDEEDVKEVIPTMIQMKTTKGREQKWAIMMERWPASSVPLRGGRRRKLVLRRLRKGVPEPQRAKVWQWLGGVQAQIAKKPGVYQKLVEEASETRPPTPPETQSARYKSFRAIQDTIERDIHRTFPRHSMFYQDDTRGESVVEVEEIKEDNSILMRSSTANLQDGCLAQSTREIADMIRQMEAGMEGGTSPVAKAAFVHPDYVPPTRVLQERGGQASLRRVLKAYSVFDREIGYCQGMNFIAGMFLTLMPEEESFWLLVAVMEKAPCRMRGLFGEGMRETHKVLHVAEQLIHCYLPRLAKHLDHEHIHVTMFATQWLLTQYTSSFPFELVVRVWDSILAEGWKMTYRLMLALLKHYETTLLQLTFEEILNFFRDLPDQVYGSDLMETAMRIPLKTRQIVKFEKEWETRGEEQGNN